MTESHHSYTISGVPIKFPCKAYPTQISMMSKIITGIDRKQNCLLESPTGSGKSLALLCSSLGWQKCEHQKQVIAHQEEANCSTAVDGMKSPHSSKVPCTMCHCQSLKEGANDVVDLTVDDPINVSPNTTLSEGTMEAVTTSSSSGVDVKASIVEDEPDSADVFQAPKIKFRTPGGSGNLSGARKGMGVIFDEDIPTTPVGRNTPGPGRTSTSGVSASQSCTCACHSSSSLCKEEKCNEEESNQDYRLPKIFFGTRTHKQIAQIIRELKKTAYSDARMAILGSREHFCVHPEVSRGHNKNDGCKELLDAKNGVSCRYYQNVQRIKTHWQLEGHGLPSAWDVEELVKLGKKIKACPYFASRSLASDADIVFCPYNYLIDPLIRSSMEISLKGQIIILDEAHNIEDSAREAASVTIMADELQDAIDELDKLINFRWREEHCRVIHTVLASLQRWIVSYSGTLSQNDFTRASRTWNGVEMVAAFAIMGVSPATFDTLKHHLSALQEEANPQIPVEQMISITSASVMLAKSLFVIIDYFFRENMVFMKDYKVVLIKTLSQRKWQGNNDNRWLNPRRSASGQVTYSLNFWCLNPAVAFSDIGGEARTIVLTSGTLSPMASFASELGVKFSVSLEANHVIQDSQIWVGSVASGPTGKSLNASYKNTETFNFQDDLGRLVLDICKTVPYGVLCFVSSYSLMFKLSERWKTTGLWHEVERTKIIMNEARGGQKKEFDEQLRDFYETIKDFEEKDITSQSLTGVLFLAVCRGKVSEGMDFADNNARAVITVGIPFPSFKDPQVELKRAYNDHYKLERGLLSGSEWYEIQAYRALNQALGRCLRHRNDWGALILVDERFRRNPNKYISGLSKWVRNRVAHFLHSRDGIESLKNFVIGRQSAASISSTQEKSPTVSQSPATGQSLNELPSSPLVKLEEYRGHSPYTPVTSTGFNKPSAVMHGFPAISISQRSRNPSMSHDVTPHVTSQTPWNTPRRLSTQVTNLNTNYSTPKGSEPSSLPTETQISSSSPQQSVSSVGRTAEQFTVLTTSTEPSSLAEHAAGSTERQIPSHSSKERPVFLKVQESPSQFAKKSSQSAQPFRQCTLDSFRCKSPQNMTCVKTPLKFCNKSQEPPELSKESTPSVTKEFDKVDINLCETSKEEQKTEDISHSNIAVTDDEILSDSKVDRLSQERNLNSGTPPPLFASDDHMEVIDGDCLPHGGDTRNGQSEGDLSHGGGTRDGQSEGDLSHAGDTRNDQSEVNLSHGGETRNGQSEGDLSHEGETRNGQSEGDLMQKGCDVDEVTCQTIKIKEEEKPADGTMDTLKDELTKEESSTVQPPKSLLPENTGGLRRSPRKKSKNIKEVNSENVALKDETVESKVTKSLGGNINVERENKAMDTINSSVEQELDKKSRLSRKSKRTSIVRGEGSVRQSPRKRHCNEERRIECETEEIKEEESLVRKSTRNRRRRVVNDAMENKNSDLMMEKTEDAGDVTCLQCSSSLCQSAEFTVVPMSEVPSPFLLQQMKVVSTPRGRKKGNKKKTGQESLVAFRVSLARGCDGSFQTMSAKKNDSQRLNAHWSDDEGCCFQPVVCSECSKTKNGTCPVIGYKINCVMLTDKRSNIIPNEVWLSSRSCQATSLSQ